LGDKVAKLQAATTDAQAKATLQKLQDDLKPLGSARAYLDALNAKRIKQNLPAIAYSYKWQVAPKAQFALWTLGGLVLIGGVWPFVVNLLSFGSLFHPKSAEEPGIDLSKVKNTSAGAAPVAMGLSAEDQDRLGELEEELESFLKSGQSAPSEAPQPAAVRVLNAGPAEEVAAEPKKQREKKAFGGEFYPTVAHAPEHPGDETKE
jgi:hypothetical protein